MSYQLKTHDVDRMEFVRERSPVVFSWLVFLLGVVAAIGGPAVWYLRYYAGIDMPVLITGFGILLIAGSFLLRMQIAALPAKLTLDNRRGVLEIAEDDGRSFALGYGDIQRVALRMRGRGRVVVTLVRTNGAYWDLFRTNRRNFASEMGRRVENFLAQGRRKERTYPTPGEVFTIETGESLNANDPATGVYWSDRLMPRAAFWIFALLAGLAVLLAGALLRAQYSLPVAAGVPGAILGAFAVYLLYGLAIGKRGLRIGADGALSAGFVRGGRWISRQSVDRANIQAVLHSFDMYGGIPQLLLPDAELLPRIIGQLQSGDSAANRRGGLARMTADLRAGLRVFRVSLSGLSAGDALALEFFVERALRERTAR